MRSEGEECDSGRMRQSLCIVRDRRFGQNVHCYVPFFLMFRTPYKLCFQNPNKFPKAWQMPVCYCIVILTIAMIRKMVIVMINMMVITYRPLVGLEAPSKQYEKSNQCNQCDFASLYASDLRIHLKTHSGEKSNKCNQCDYASSREGHLRRHLKTHSGENSKA